MMGRDSHKRKRIIAANYKPLHPHLYTLQVNVKHFSFGMGEDKTWTPSVDQVHGPRIFTTPKNTVANNNKIKIK